MEKQNGNEHYLTTSAKPSSSSSSNSADEKRAERMKRLRDLHLRRVRNKAMKEENLYANLPG